MPVRRRLLGLSLTGGGLIAVTIGLLMLASSGLTIATTTTTTAPSTTTTTTTVPVTTTTAPPTTTAPTTTTTTTPPETVEDFIVAYREALDSDDLEFLTTRLHPRVVEAYGEEVCRDWIEAEVVAIESYELVEVLSGPADQVFTDPEGSQFPIADTFTATVTFSFQGEAFESQAQFALLDHLMYWLGTCR